MISERRFSGLLAQIYEAAGDFSRWPEALRGIAGAYNAPTVVFGAVGSNNESLWQIAPGVDSEYHERYTAYYHRINPIIPIALPSKVGSVLTDEMMLEKREFVRTEFFNDFLTPLDAGSMLGSTVLSEEGLYCAIAVQRRPAFGEREIMFQRRLAPHLARAVQLNARLSALDQRSSGFRRCARPAVSGRDRRRQRGSRAVRQSGSRASDGAARLPADRGRRAAGPFRAAVREAEGADRRMRRRRAKRKPAALCDCPARAMDARCPRSSCRCAARPRVLPVSATGRDRVRIRPEPDPCEFWAQLRRRFGLTKAEAAFALEIAKGDGIQASADRLGVSLSTARTHLARIFEKTDTRRQAELVRLLMAVTSSPG